jgi:hypothetical protein
MGCGRAYSSRYRADFSAKHRKHTDLTEQIHTLTKSMNIHTEEVHAASWRR